MCGRTKGIWSHIVAGTLVAAVVISVFHPSRARADDLDLKKLFEESIPDSPFIAVVYKYADTMLEHGRDTFGPRQTGLFLSALDRKSLKPLDVRPAAPAGVVESSRPGAAGEPLVGADVQLDQNLLRLLYFLSEMSNDARYAQAADANLTWWLRETRGHSPGLPPWARRVAWNIAEDEAFIGEDAAGRGFSRPWMLWQRCYDLDHEASAAAAAALRRHRGGDAAKVGATAEHPRQVGFLIRAWADAFATTTDNAFVEATDAVLTKIEENEGVRVSAGKGERTGTKTNSFEILSLAIDLDGAARKMPEPLRGRLTALAADLDRSFLALPHEPSTTLGFVAELASREESPRRRSSLWNPSDGPYTTAGVGVMCMSRYANSGDIGCRDLIVAAADAYLNAAPDDSVDAWPLTFGQAITLELAAFRVTADERYHARAFQLGQIAVASYFGDSPLPKASLKSEHYEATTGAATLALALAELHLSTRTITAVRTPANTIDR